MNYDEAVIQLYRKRRIHRKSWHENKFIYLITGQDFQNAFKYGYGEYINEPEFISAIALKNERNQIVIGWKASPEDVAATDWVSI